MQVGPLKLERPKGTQRRGREREKLDLKQGIQRLAWEVVKARGPGGKAQGPRKGTVGPPAQKARGTQNPAPTADGGHGHRDLRTHYGCSRAHRAATPGREPAPLTRARPVPEPPPDLRPTHTAPFRKPLSTANAVW